MSNIREHVLRLAKSKVVKGFYPTGVAKRLKLSLPVVEAELNEMVKEGLIQKGYHLLCHNDICLKELDTKSNKEEFEKEYNCVYCGEEIEEINDSFIQVFYSGNHE